MFGELKWTDFIHNPDSICRSRNKNFKNQCSQAYVYFNYCNFKCFYRLTIYYVTPMFWVIMGALQFFRWWWRRQTAEFWISIFYEKQNTSNYRQCIKCMLITYAQRSGQSQSILPSLKWTNRPYRQSSENDGNRNTDGHCICVTLC